jgi:serine/threonine protein kinase
MRAFLLCCFQKNPDERPTAKTLKDHPWIQQHLPKPSSPVLPDPSNENSATKVPALDSKNQVQRRRRSSTRTSTESLRKMEPQDHHHHHHHPHTPLMPMEEEDYATHRFIQTSFGKSKSRQKAPVMKLLSDFFFL